jgi:hypothetical protein
MAEIRPSLRPDHRQVLQAFVRLVHEMEQCRFVQKFSNQDQTVSGCSGPNGPEITQAPSYDWDDFCSFMTMFRKVGIAKKEPTYLTKVFKLVGLYASDALREWLKANKDAVVRTVEGAVEGWHFNVKTSDEVAKLSTWKVLDMVTNGIIFHEEERYRSVVESLNDGPRWPYIWTAMNTSIVHILNIGIILSGYLYQDGILKEVDYPVEWRRIHGDALAANSQPA